MNKPEDSSARHSRIAWAGSLVINGVLLFALWQVPALRQRVLEINPKDEMAAKEQDTLRKEMEKRIGAKREKTPLDEKVKEQVLARLEQEKTHRAMEKVRELKEIYDRMAEDRDERISEFLEEAAQKPVTEAVEDLRTSLMELAEREEQLAERLLANAEKRPELAETNRKQAGELTTMAETARKQAVAIDGSPTPELAEQLRELAVTSTEISRKAKENATDLTTGARAEAVEKEVSEMLEALERAIETKAAEVPADAIAQADIPHLPELTPPTAEIAEGGKADSLEQVWEAATEIEKAINSVYDQTRTVELAKVAEVDFAEAATRVLPTPTPERQNPFEEAVREDAASPPDLSGDTAAMNEAERQINEIARMAENRMALAEQSSDGGEEIDASKLFARSEMERVAFSSRRFTDVSAMMREMLDGEGSEGDDDPDKDTSGEPPRADSKSVRRKDRLTDGAVLNALPGRRFSSSSPRKGWLYLDTWYVIGPWSNNNITSFEPSHPPEQGINLDARYEGSIYTEPQAAEDQRSGVDRGYVVGQSRHLRWLFTQSDGARLVFPDERANSTYFAYTDVYFEEAQEMLVAMGTDDSGRLWINDLPVGQDAGLSPWAIDETVRKVYFKKGYNTILVRLENGPQDAELSFLICPPEALR